MFHFCIALHILYTYALWLPLFERIQYSLWEESVLFFSEINLHSWKLCHKLDKLNEISLSLSLTLFQTQTPWWSECLQHPNIQLPIPLTCKKNILRIWPCACLLFSEDHSSLWKVLWWRQRAPKNYRYKLVSSWRKDL